MKTVYAPDSINHLMNSVQMWAVSSPVEAFFLMTSVLMIACYVLVNKS